MPQGVRRSLVVAVVLASVVAVSSTADAAWARTEQGAAGVTYTGSWSSYSASSASGGSYRGSPTAGNTVGFAFSGTGVRWIGKKSRYAGITDVKVDGVKVATVDGYRSGTLYQAVLYTNTSLAPGSHTIQLVVTGRKRSVAKGRYTYVDAFDVTSSSTSTPPPSTPPPPTPPPADALHRRVQSELHVFTDWLAANSVKGYIGEVGWPDDYRGDAAKWNALAQDWYGTADAAGLWVTNWASGEWWGNSYILGLYEDSNGDEVVDRANTQSSVVEAHPSNASYQRGVNDAGAEFGYCPQLEPTSSFSNTNSGTYGYDYHYDSQATFDYFASRGLAIVRLPFRWERLQRTPGGALDPTELGRLQGAVTRARNAGLKVILDPHNFGAYYLSDGTQGVRRPIGSTQMPMSLFADLWTKLSTVFKNDTGVVGYALMNEPVGLPSTPTLSADRLWEQASQAALTAIRNNGDTKLVLVPGNEWDGASTWSTHHPVSWISDPANSFRYEAHHYWDRDNSGAYTHTYDEEVADAAARGY